MPTHLAPASSSKPADRLFAVLELIADLGMASSADLVHVLNFPRPTAHRILGQLEEMGLVQKSPYPGKYAASPRLTHLASGLMHSTLVRAPLRALLVSLSRVTGQAHHIAMLSQGEVEYFEVVETSALPLTFPAGKRAPPHCNASGQYFLSQLPKKRLDQFMQSGPWQAFTKNTITSPQALIERIAEIRRKDYAVQDSEFVQGVIGLAVPIRTPRGRLAAMLAARADNSQRTVQQVEQLVPIMRSYAARAGKFF